MKKRLLSYLLIGALLLSPAYAALLPNFAEVNSYKDGQFTDVPTSAWYAESVATAYRLDIVSGKSATRFDPAGELTLAEAIKLACVIHSIYHTGSAAFAAGDPWYRPYVDYALKNKILLSEYKYYDMHAKRSDFALLFSRALPADALASINKVEDGAIPDVPVLSRYADAVYTLYRAGILTGSDTTGTFHPSKYIARSEVAAIVTRMANTDLRRTISLWANGNALTAEHIFASCAPAVFSLEIYDKAGKAISSGSGFFLSSDGRAVTSYHVIENAYTAKAFTKDGKSYNITGMYGGSDALDLALLQVAGTGFPFLTRGDSKAMTTGTTVFAIGSPLGLDSTISQGVVSGVSRTVNGSEYIPVTTPISPGASGGALIDSTGKVIGVTTSGIISGQSINLAVPIHLLGELKVATTPAVLPGGVTSTPGTSTKYYEGQYPVPDYGVYVDAPLYAKSNSDSRDVVFAYRQEDVYQTDEYAITGYLELLEKNGFEQTGNFLTEDTKRTFLVYKNDGYKFEVCFGTDIINGEDCFVVMIHFPD